MLKDCHDQKSSHLMRTQWKTASVLTVMCRLSSDDCEICDMVVNENSDAASDNYRISLWKK